MSSAESQSAVGRSAELLLAARLLTLGHKVATPLVDDHTVDLIVNYRTTVQVKASGSRDERGRLSIALGTPLPTHVDVLSVYALDAEHWWHIPRQQVGLGRTIKLCESWQRGPSTWLDAWQLFVTTPGG
ncbi:hypothetical protein [Micromonospora rubida]